MTLILTAPERLSFLCLDIDARIKYAFWTMQHNLDLAKRPAFLIKIDEASFPQVANSIVEPDETYVIDYIGQQFDQGEANTYELMTREIAYKTFHYFFGRTQLQFTNTLARQPAQLTALNGVKWARMTRRSPVNIMTGNGITEPFWGFSYSITLTEGIRVNEQLVAKL